jgi:glycosyltransferase involved in cell wall biosynthesis
VIFHGFQDPKEFYIRAKIFVMTSDYEGLPMTIIEAQTLGAVPVAYNSFSSITEIITKDSGIIIDFGDDHGFEMAIQTLMSDSDLLQKMMVSGLQNAQKFAPDIIAQKWMELFEGK